MEGGDVGGAGVVEGAEQASNFQGGPVARGTRSGGKRAKRQRQERCGGFEGGGGGGSAGRTWI